MSNPVDPLRLEHFLPYRLSVLSSLISRRIADVCEREFGLSISQWRIMAVLACYPDLSAGEVAERSAMDKVAVSRGVNTLLASRRLMRSYDKEDRRRSMLRLSPIGHAVYKRIAPMALNYEQSLLDSLSPADRRTFGRLIDVLTECAKTSAGLSLESAPAGGMVRSA
ncbi:hypothetical protein ACG33_02455 [Steroidobacter denitrificans]|uniref:HTH marR-type domain-containing protein n=2 Tax=Steroidobacter denitrificans TaxID=465721 RepID=A0A127F8V0_STEDE|nr:hypothetical protein ACG33_02455 [Steroidobacter denitrificans]